MLVGRPSPCTVAIASLHLPFERDSGCHRAERALGSIGIAGLLREPCCWVARSSRYAAIEPIDELSPTTARVLGLT